jgi:hypothetical protein
MENYRRFQVQFHTISHSELILLLRKEPRWSNAFDKKSDGPQSQSECRQEIPPLLSTLEPHFPGRQSCTQSVSLNTEDTSALRKLLCTLASMGRESSVGIATRYGLDGPGTESRCGWDLPHPSRPSLRPTHNGYRVSPGGKAAGAWRWPLTPSSADVKERAELYLYSSSVLGLILPLLLPVRTVPTADQASTNMIRKS